MQSKQNRRTFIQKSTALALGLGTLGWQACGSDTGDQKGTQTKQAMPETPKTDLFKISLAQWSLHRTIFDGELKALDFAAYARNQFDIDAIEYVNQFFKEFAEDPKYINELRTRAADVGVKSLLIMVDGEGELGNLNDDERRKAVENHHKWVTAAKLLGCHSIRVNAAGNGTREEVASAAIDGLGRLAEYADQLQINVIVENHGGYSSDGGWLSNVIKQVNQPNCGTLPDFGNFKISSDPLVEYDRYKGVRELMPYAKAVSAKTHDFNESGEEIHTDYKKMMKIVLDAGYNGYVGIEYEGSQMSEQQGIAASLNLLKQVRTELSQQG
ncbi:MAG: sugar phosphate isomerase/epimerase [Saprospiraceae bacterium]|nr:sugar phosphate isomerase/epimerase [Saprospiraceae bacterium]